MELSMCAFLSASFQKCMPLGGTAAMAAWRWRQERRCCWEQKVQSCSQTIFRHSQVSFWKQTHWDKMYTNKYTRIYIHIYIRICIYGLRNLTSPGIVGWSWQRFVSWCPESCATITPIRLFSFLLWETSLFIWPPAWPGKGRWSHWEYSNYPSWEETSPLFCQQRCFSSVWEESNTAVSQHPFWGVA